MSGSLGYLNIHLALDQIKFQRNLEQAQKRAKQFSDRTTQYLNNIEKAAISINRATSANFNFEFIIKPLTGLAQQTLRYAETNTELANRLRLVTENSIQLAQATESVFDIALKTNQSVSATSEVYQRFAKNADTLGLSLSEVAELTEITSKAVAISGASAASAQAALMQFGQALASGELRGAELNSVMEQTPGLAEAIAKGLGVTIGQLRAMGKAGELDVKKVVTALKNAKDAVNADFEKRIKTVSQAMTNFNTNLIKSIGELDKASGVTATFAESIEFVAQHLDQLVKIASVLVAVGLSSFLGGYTNKMLGSAIATGKATIEHLRQSKAVLQSVQAKLREAQANQALLVSQYNLAQSERTRLALREQMKAQAAQIIVLAKQEKEALQSLSVAQKLSAKAGGLLKGALGLIGGPVGAAMLAGGALYYFSQQADQARQKALDTAGANEKLSQSYHDLSEAALTKAILEQIKDLKNLEEQIKSVNREIHTSQLDYHLAGLDVPDSVKRDILELNAKLGTLTENQQINIEVLEKQLVMLGVNFERSGKSAAAFKEQLRIMGVASEVVERILSKVPTEVNRLKESTGGAEKKTLDLSDALKKLNEKSVSLAQRLEVATLKQQGQAKTAFVLAGLYELLGKEGEAYNEVLKGIANGTITAANAADKAVGISVDTLNKIFEGKKLLEKDFANQNKLDFFSAGAKTDYSKQFTDQVTQLQQRLSEVKANARDISLFGEVSQYQEVNKLTQDIAANAEKYAHFGAEGVAKLKSLAREIDVATQEFNITKFSNDNKQKLAQMELELSLLGKTRQEQELMRYNHQLDIEAAKLKIGMTQENIALLDQEIAKLKEKYALIQAEAEAKRKDAIEGVKNGLRTIEEDVTNVAGNISNITVSAFNGMSNALTDFVLTGKANFADLAKSIIADITNMIIKMMIFNALKSALGGTALGGFLGFSEGGLVGFAVGGYTGDGGKYAPAGIVHKGEYVITKEATSRIGLDYLNYLNYGKRGFASGGGVAVPRVPTMPNHTQRQGDISVKVINNGEPAQAKVSAKQEQGQLAITVELMKKIADEQIGKHHNTFMRNRRLNGNV